MPRQWVLVYANIKAKDIEAMKGMSSGGLGFVLGKGKETRST
jgi:hypothetical protein